MEIIVVRPLKDIIDPIIKEAVYTALLATNGNKVKAAKLLQINRGTLSKHAKGIKFKKHNLRIQKFKMDQIIK